MAEALLVGGPWDGHRERLDLDPQGQPPRSLPRVRDTTIYTEDTGHLPVRIPERGYRLRGPDPDDDTGSRWIYEPDPDDPLS